MNNDKKCHTDPDTHVTSYLCRYADRWQRKINQIKNHTSI